MGLWLTMSRSPAPAWRYAQPVTTNNAQVGELIEQLYTALNETLAYETAYHLNVQRLKSLHLPVIADSNGRYLSLGLERNTDVF
jgi:hypothetical protein